MIQAKLWIIIVPLVLTFSVQSESFQPLPQFQSESVMVAKRKLKKKKLRKKKLRKKRRRKRSYTSNRQELVQALRLVKQGQFQEASMRLFQLAHNPRFRDRKMQLKYLLGLMLHQMNMPQTAAFQFISVVRDGKSQYLQRALEKLSLVADSLGDDTLLNYAISRVKVDSFPRVHRDMLFFRIGEFQLRNQQFAAAASSFKRVRRNSPLYPKSRYLEGLAYAELKKNKSAFMAFEDLAEYRSSKGITDKVRVSAIMGQARIYYQAKKWNKAIETYRQIPRDTENWHNTLFESSWAMLQSGRFRSALSNFHSLHSSFYENQFLPESILLRSLIYLYICKYDEMEKVLNLFNKIYKPIYRDITSFLKTRSAEQYFTEVVRAMEEFKKEGDQLDYSQFNLPFVVIRKVFQEGDFQRSYQYINRLLAEKKNINNMSSLWRDSAIGNYSKKILKKRLSKARKYAGMQIRSHLDTIREDLFDLFEQEGFIRYEMINGKKEALKKKISGKDLPDAQVDEEAKRDYYIQNGYEYWPFRGEYWIDELGNYHYVGTQSCN